MKFEFENFSREIDNTDVKFVCRYEKALEDFYKNVAGIDMKGSASEIYSKICFHGKEMMDTVFGDGAAKEMFGESQSVRRVMAAVCGLNSFMNDIGSIIEDMKELEQHVNQRMCSMRSGNRM